MGKKTFDIDSSVRIPSVSNGDITFIKEQEFILKKMDRVKVMIAKHSILGSFKMRHLSSECRNVRN